jgi:hypothetical protein
MTSVRRSTTGAVTSVLARSDDGTSADSLVNGDGLMAPQ